MSLWSTLTSWFRPRAAEESALTQPSPWLVQWAGGGRTRAGVGMSPQSAMGISTYYDCLRIISEDVAKLPLFIYERTGTRGKRRAPDHPLYTLLHDAPNPEMTSMAFRETLTHHMLGWGNGYAWIERQAGEIVALWPIHPSFVYMRRADGEIVYDIRLASFLPGENLTRTVYRVRAEDMLHVHGLGPDGHYGYSIAQLAAESLGLTLAAEEFGAHFFGDDATPSGVLTHPQRLSPEATQNLRQSWEERHQGTRKIAVLEEGMTFTSTTIPPEQGQFIETRQFQMREVCRWFRMPPTKIGDYEFATYSNIEQAAIDYVVDTLTPWLSRWEQEYARKLFVDDPTYFAEHQVQGLMRGDSASRGEFYTRLFGMASLSPNEIRSFENLEEIGPEGDTFFVATNNLAPLKTVLAQPTPEEEDDTSQNAFPVTIPGHNGSQH
jgi:HK97 family phage portal protein